MSDERAGHQHGFSLLETMMVVAIILILATISAPYYQTIIKHAHETVLREDLFTMRTQIDRFTHDNECAPASLQELVEKGYLGQVPRDPFTGSSETWTVDQESASLAVDDSAPSGIVDVHSGAEGASLDSTAYGTW